MSWGEIAADVWEASILPASFGLARVEIDHTAAIAVTATIAVATMILRISCHLAWDETARCIGTSSPAQAWGTSHRGWISQQRLRSEPPALPRHCRESV